MAPRQTQFEQGQPGPSPSGEVSRDLTAQLRRAYRSLVPERPASPEDGEVASLVLGEAEGETRLRLADQVVASPSGVVNYQLLRELHQEVQRQKSSLTQPAKEGRRRLLSMPVALAAAAALVLAVGVAQVQRSGEMASGSAPGEIRSDTLRSSGTALAASSWPADGAQLDAAPSDFQWPAQVGAETYRLRLFDAGAEVIWESEPLATTELTLPPEVATRLQAGDAYFWVVDVSGSVQRSSLGPSWFRLEG